MKIKFIGIFLALTVAFSAMLCGCSELEDVLNGIEVNVETTAEVRQGQQLQGETAVSDNTEIRDTAVQVRSTEAISADAAVQTQSAPAVQTEQQTQAAEPMPAQTTVTEPQVTTTVKSGIEKNGSYTSPEDVAEYIHTFGTLPENFITKEEARELGWDNKAGNLWEVAPGKSIGGDYFGNYEGLLPEAEGRKYTECDVNYDGGYRGSERIIFSNDGLIYYTKDHYESFTLMYGEE